MVGTWLTQGVHESFSGPAASPPPIELSRHRLGERLQRAEQRLLLSQQLVDLEQPVIRRAREAERHHVDAASRKPVVYLPLERREFVGLLAPSRFLPHDFGPQFVALISAVLLAVGLGRLDGLATRNAKLPALGSLRAGWDVPYLGKAFREPGHEVLGARAALPGEPLVHQGKMPLSAGRLQAATPCGCLAAAAQMGMPFAIYLEPESAPSLASGEDYLVPDTPELIAYLSDTPLKLGRPAESTLTPVHDLAAHLAPGAARDALLDLEEPSMVLVVTRP